MKHNPQIYARAFLEVWKKAGHTEEEKILANFSRLIQRNGDQGRWPAILEAIEKELVAGEGGRIVEVESARLLPKEQVEHLKRQFTLRDRVRFRQNPYLVAGVRVTWNGERELDNTLSRKLKQIF